MKLKIKKNIPILLSIIMLGATAAIFNGKKGEEKKESLTLKGNVDGSYKIRDSSIEGQELRAVWIPFMSLDVKNNFSQEAFENKFEGMIKAAKEHKANALIVHVRPYGDAIYPSKVFPWSHILTGEQGKDPEFDPLLYMIKKTHDSGLKFHAWINPFRVRCNGTPVNLSENNPAYKMISSEENKENDIIMKCGEDLYYNPAYSQVRKLIIDGVKEIVENYDVDGVHFDDYFYPKDHEEIDSCSYNKYVNSLSEGSVPLDLQRFRMDNVNALVSGVYSAIKSVKPNVSFGVSPAGNIDNAKFMGADVESWGNNEGYVDYLCPQLYFNFEHKTLPFKKAADDWRNLIKNQSVKLYLGVGLYKAGSDFDLGTWKNCSDILKREIEYSRDIGYDGFMLYSIDYLDREETKEEVLNVMKILN